MCENEDGVAVFPSGFVASVEEPWLGASPDAIVDLLTNGIVEVKCPFVCRECTLEEVANGSKPFCVQSTPDGLVLDRSHSYFHQVQVQLFVCKAKFCDFVVWSPRPHRTHISLARLFS